MGKSDMSESGNGPELVDDRLDETDTHDDSRQVLDSIRRIVQLLRRTAIVPESRRGLSTAKLFVLRKLDGESTLSIGQLAARTLTSQSTVSEVVQKLVDTGLVARVRSARDGRSVEVSLTDAGREALRGAPAAPQDFLLAGLHRLPARDRKHLSRLLARLVKEVGMVDVTPRMLFDDEDNEP